MFHSGTDELLELYKSVYELYRELKMDAPGQPVRVSLAGPATSTAPSAPLQACALPHILCAQSLGGLAPL